MICLCWGQSSSRPRRWQTILLIQLPRATDAIEGQVFQDCYDWPDVVEGSLLYPFADSDWPGSLSLGQSWH